MSRMGDTLTRFKELQGVEGNKGQEDDIDARIKANAEKIKQLNGNDDVPSSGNSSVVSGGNETAESKTMQYKNTFAEMLGWYDNVYDSNGEFNSALGEQGKASINEEIDLLKESGYLNKEEFDNAKGSDRAKMLKEAKKKQLYAENLRISDKYIQMWEDQAAEKGVDKEQYVNQKIEERYQESGAGVTLEDVMMNSGMTEEQMNDLQNMDEKQIIKTVRDNYEKNKSNLDSATRERIDKYLKFTDKQDDMDFKSMLSMKSGFLAFVPSLDPSEKMKIKMENAEKLKERGELSGTTTVLKNISDWMDSTTGKACIAAVNTAIAFIPGYGILKEAGKMSLKQGLKLAGKSMTTKGAENIIKGNLRRCVGANIGTIGKFFRSMPNWIKSGLGLQAIDEVLGQIADNVGDNSSELSIAMDSITNIMYRLVFTDIFDLATDGIAYAMKEDGGDIRKQELDTLATITKSSSLTNEDYLVNITDSEDGRFMIYNMLIPMAAIMSDDERKQLIKWTDKYKMTGEFAKVIDETKKRYKSIPPISPDEFRQRYGNEADFEQGADEGSEVAQQ